MARPAILIKESTITQWKAVRLDIQGCLHCTDAMTFMSHVMENITCHIPTTQTIFSSGTFTLNINYI